MEVFVITYIPSPYQVELFDALEAQSSINLTVCYVQRKAPDRQWSEPVLQHEAYYLTDPEPARTLDDLVRDSDVVIFSYYHHRRVRQWMWERNAARAPWCFWGERPGFTYDGFLGRWYRRLRLWPLYRSTAPIWGIGEWAIKGYQREFGPYRPYMNIPYFSDLERFRAIAERRPQSDNSPFIRVLYSGSLIKRKGVDLLATAFLELVRDKGYQMHLDILGQGLMGRELRAILDPVRDNVTFLGFKPWNELPGIYGRADVLCAPSRYDGWGLIIPEGLAAGLPVIATDKMGAAHDLLSSGTNGWVVKAGARRALVRALTAATEDGNLAEMSQAAQESVSSHQLIDGVEKFVNALERTKKHWSD